MGKTILLMTVTILVLMICCCNGSQVSGYFIIRVFDEDTGRGVPMVELKFPNDVKYWTDSAGIAVINEPSFIDREVFITVRSDGYEYLEETPFGNGALVRIEPERTKELSIHRIMIAERLYRLTGEGIYRDCVMADISTPMKMPLMNAQVLGQDTAVGAIYRGKIFWIWGDTIGPTYFNFRVSGATSDLDDDPAVAVNFDYFTDQNGHAKEMFPHQGKGLVWIEGLIPITDPDGEERLVATYTRQDGLKFPDECGLALFDDQLQIFKPWVRMSCRDHHISSHPFLHDGYWYFYPWLRVPNDWAAIQDSSRWETRNVELPSDPKRPSCVVWNEYRHRWILLAEDSGDVYYAEAARPEGPYGKAVRIIEHDQYNFYNVVTHPFFNKKDGREIYIEGTYTDSFSDAAEKTPRYNYNQVMYRLELDDPRLMDAYEL